MDADEIRSLAQLFQSRVAETPDRRAFQYPSNGDWKWLTWSETDARVRAIAGGLLCLGVEREDRCAILCATRIEWILGDLGILCAGAATTTVYPSNTPEECQYILDDSGSVLVFAEDDEQVAKLQEVRSSLPRVRKVVTFDGAPSEDGWVIGLDELERLGIEHEKKNPGAFQASVDAVGRHHLSNLIYTSGTTGAPKGVELTQDNWVFAAFALADLGAIGSDDHQYLWLPLSHSFGKLLEVSQLAIGFSTTIDGRIPKLVANLAVAKPTFMAAAPRIFEKVYNKVVSGAQEAGGLKYAIFRWAVGIGRQVSRLRQSGREPSGLLALQYKIADALVFSKLQQTFGGRIRFFISGAAPLSREIAEFFHAAGVLILEGYGLTETSAGSFVNRLESFAFGTVGPPLSGVEVKIDEADGEILIRGRGVMRGYRNREEATAEVLVGDGWLRTGDIGELDGQGRLKITDRKKDLIKTSGGKYVAPQSLEGQLKALCPYLGQIVVHGDNRNYCTALITIDEESIAGWKEEAGLKGASYEELTRDPRVIDMVQEAVNELNERLASYETIKKFALLPADLSVETGELTPSLKVKRKVVEKKYQHLLDGFYQGSVSSI